MPGHDITNFHATINHIAHDDHENGGLGMSITTSFTSQRILPPNKSSVSSLLRHLHFPRLGLGEYIHARARRTGATDCQTHKAWKKKSRVYVPPPLSQNIDLTIPSTYIFTPHITYHTRYFVAAVRSKQIHIITYYYVPFFLQGPDNG